MWKFSSVLVHSLKVQSCACLSKRHPPPIKFKRTNWSLSPTALVHCTQSSNKGTFSFAPISRSYSSFERAKKTELDSHSGNCAISNGCPIWLIKVRNFNMRIYESRDLAGSGGYHTLLRQLLLACNSTSGTVRNAIQRSFSRSFQTGFLSPAKPPF